MIAVVGEKEVLVGEMIIIWILIILWRYEDDACR